MVMIAAYVYLLVLTSLCFVGGVFQGVERDVSWDFELDETITRKSRIIIIIIIHTA